MGRERNAVLVLLRTLAGYSQLELAERLYVDRNVVHRMETGADYPAHMYVAWVNACGGEKVLDLLNVFALASEEVYHLLQDSVAAYTLNLPRPEQER